MKITKNVGRVRIKWQNQNKCSPGGGQNLQSSFLTRDIKEFNVIILILIGILLVSLAGVSSLALFSGESVGTENISGKVVRSGFPNASDALIKKVGTGGLVADSHPATTQLKATTAYRYTGKNPDNYISFNDEVWRIVGVFETDDGTGKLEKRLKIMRNAVLGTDIWSSSSTPSDGGLHDWTNSNLMANLNKYDYYNKTSTYSSTGLNNSAKRFINKAKWYLGGTDEYESDSNGTASHFYKYERGTNVYSKDYTLSTSWVGDLGLIYPSDYGYATSGGTNTNREACLKKSLSSWAYENDCTDNNWMYVERQDTWTITLSSDGMNAFVYNSYYNFGKGGMTGKAYFKPTLYLRGDLLLSGGDGTLENPYTIAEPATNAVETILSTADSSEFISQSHPATAQMKANTDYRYIDSNPNNNIKFNDQNWKIVGIFDVDNGTGKFEKRLKITTTITKNTWDDNGINDWTISTLKQLLNEGDYWNRTGTYATTGLTEKSKELIGDAKWYLGGSDIQYPTTFQFYNYERGTSVYEGRPISWVGKVGLLYPSDLGFATSGGDFTRSRCLNYELYNWQVQSAWDCHGYDWLSNSSGFRWYITPYSKDSSSVFGGQPPSGYISYWGTGKINVGTNMQIAVYLKSDAKIYGIHGTGILPYIVVEE